MTPELTAAVARLEKLADALIATGEAGPFMSAQALRLVLAAVTPREGAEIEDRIGSALPTLLGDGHCAYVHETADERSPKFALVYGANRDECLARARDVAQVAAREVERG